MVREVIVPIDHRLPSIKGDFTYHFWHSFIESDVSDVFVPLSECECEGAKNIIWIAHFRLTLHIDKTITNFQQSTVIVVFKIR